MSTYTEYGIEPEEGDRFPKMLRLFNPDTGIRSQWFNGEANKDQLGNLIPPAWAIEQVAPPPAEPTPAHIGALPAIAKHLETTNNGKLITARLPAHLRQYVPGLLAGGYLSRATFIETGDSIRLSKFAQANNLPTPGDTYLQDPNHCPRCGHSDINGGPVETGNGTATQEMDCSYCGGSWTDHYRLRAFEFEDNTRAPHDL